MNFDVGERDFLLDMRSLTTDPEGEDIFVGLTRHESDEFFRLTRLDAPRHDGAGERYQELDEKMEAARFQVLAAEHILRTESPTRN